MVGRIRTGGAVFGGALRAADVDEASRALIAFVPGQARLLPCMNGRWVLYAIFSRMTSASGNL